jgi:hypothetical protein
MAKKDEIVALIAKPSSPCRFFAFHNPRIITGLIYLGF